MIPTCHERLRPSPCEFRAQKTRTELATRGSESARHVWIIILSGGSGSVWGSSLRLQCFYVIPGSGVVRQLSAYQKISSNRAPYEAVCTVYVAEALYPSFGYIHLQISSILWNLGRGKLYFFPGLQIQANSFFMDQDPDPGFGSYLFFIFFLFI